MEIPVDTSGGDKFYTWTVNLKESLKNTGGPKIFTVECYDLEGDKVVVSFDYELMVKDKDNTFLDECVCILRVAATERLKITVETILYEGADTTGEKVQENKITIYLTSDAIGGYFEGLKIPKDFFYESDCLRDSITFTFKITNAELTEEEHDDYRVEDQFFIEFPKEDVCHMLNVLLQRN